MNSMVLIMFYKSLEKIWKEILKTSNGYAGDEITGDTRYGFLFYIFLNNWSWILVEKVGGY